MIKLWGGGTLRGFLAHLMKALPVLIGALLITDFAESAGWFDALKSSALDSVILGKARRTVDDIVIVEITDEDYVSLFGGQSPLDRTQLHAVLGAIRAGNPRLIVVDVDTSEWQSTNSVIDPAPIPCDPVIVWAQGARIVGDGRGKRPVVHPVPFADGGQDQDQGHTAKPCVAALAVFPQDRDGVVRRYLRTIPIAGTDAGNTNAARVDSLPWKVFKTDTRQPMTAAGDAEESKDDEELVLNFAGDRYAFPRYASSAVLEQASAGRAWSDHGPLTRRIVILGGTFRAARDEYRTPLGTMSGADVLAQAIASERLGGGIREVNKFREKIVELTVAVLIVYVGYLGYKRAALIADVAGIPILALAGSWFAFSTLDRWLDFAPYWVSMAIQQALTSLSGESEAHSEPAKSAPAAAAIAPLPDSTVQDTKGAGGAAKAGSGQQHT